MTTSEELGAIRHSVEVAERRLAVLDAKLQAKTLTRSELYEREMTLDCIKHGKEVLLRPTMCVTLYTQAEMDELKATLTAATVFLVGFFRLKKVPEFGFERMQLHGIFKSEQEARDQMSFCDEAGWYQGALIEEREFGYQHGFADLKRIWLMQQSNGEMLEIPEPADFKCVANLVG